MKSKFTNFYIKLSLYLSVFVGLSASSSFAQGFAGGGTYIVNGQTDKVFPRDTFVNLMGPGNSGVLVYLNDTGINVTQPIGLVTILLDAGYTGVEAAAIQVGRSTGAGYPNMSSTRPIVLKPKAGLNFVISTSAVLAANSSLFRIFGSTDFTIDGSGTSGQRNITFNMGSNTTSSLRIIDIIPSSSASSNRIRNVSVKNCILVGNSSATAINTYAGIYFGGASATPQNALLGTNLNISYTNNLIMAVQNGIYHRGLPSNTQFPSQDTAINITNNIIGDYSNPINAANSASIGGTAVNGSGIYIQNVSNSIISGNVVRNTLGLNNASVNGGFAGIRLGTDGNQLALDSNIRIVKNQMYNLFTNSANQGIFGIRVSLGSHGTGRKILIANNSISKIASVNGAVSINSIGSYTSGVLIDNAASYVGLEMFYNTINLFGDTMANSSVSACLVTGNLTNGGIKLLNNSFSNKFGSTVGNTFGYQNYVIVTGANNVNPFSYSNFNNYYSNTFGGGYAFVAGITVNNVITHISTLKSFRSYSASDSNSFAIVPPLMNDTTCLVSAGVSNRIYNRGYVLNMLNLYNKPIFDSIQNKITDDILGNSRSGLGRFTSIGCHQWNGDSLNFPVPLIGGGTYPINGVSNPPTFSNPSSGSFKDISDAVSYLNSNGIIGGSGNQTNVTLQITSTYPRETTWIPAIIDYPGSNPGLTVTIKPQVGVIDTIWTPNTANQNNSSVLRFVGAKNIIVDGLVSNNKNTRNLTFMFRGLSTNPNSRVISITPTDVPCQNITIKNINILGNTTDTTINTYAGIFYGHPFVNSIPPSTTDLIRTVSNNNVSILNNLVQGVRNGIVIRGNSANAAATAETFAATAAGVFTFRIYGLKISGNIIGGNTAPRLLAGPSTLPTTYVGGATDQAGIYLTGVESAIIDSNVIRNCISRTNLSNGFKGIDIAEISSTYVNFDVAVTKNFIYNLNTATGATTTGIRAQFTAPAGARSYLIANNSISKLLSVGAGTSISISNPTGILIDATLSQTASNLVTIANNTVNMNGNNILSVNSGITALYLGSNIKGGISSVNNIFGVTANRNTAGNMYSTTVLSATSPFAQNPVFLTAASDFNSYFVSGNNPSILNNILMATPAATPTTRTNINALRTYTGKNVDLSSFNYGTLFQNDSMPDIIPVSAGSRFTSGIPNSLVLTDIYGVSRAAGTNVGAVKFDVLNSPLQPNGNYQINGIDNFPTLGNPTSGSFKNLRSAVNYLNAFGTGLSFSGLQPAKLVINSGYVGETDTFFTPITVLDFPFANASVPVIVTVATGRTDTIKFTNFKSVPAANTSLIRFTSGQYFGFDGSNNGSKTRDLTIIMPDSMNLSSHKIIDILGGQSSIFSQSLSSSNNFVTNCNLIGNSSTTAINTFAAIYMGGISATPSNSAGGDNSGNTFTNNFIGGCQYGIYLRGNGVRGQGDNNNNVLENVIGGNIAPGSTKRTNYFGGIANAAGIFCVGQYKAQIRKNQIQNNIKTFANPRGIELATIAGQNTILDSANIIDGNIIRNIRSTVAASNATGIYMNFGTDLANVLNSTKMYNNMISGISAPGTTTLMNGVNGIAIDAGANFSSPNIQIHFNSINLTAVAGDSLTTGSRSACLAIAPQFVLDVNLINKNGFEMKNNLFSNLLGGKVGQTGVRASAVQVGGLLSPFSTSENNNYFVNATNATNAQMLTNANTASPVTYNGWDSLNKFTGGDYFSTNFTVPFTSDTNLFIPTGLNSFLFGGAVPIVGISNDVIDNPRQGSIPTLGAHEYNSGVNVDAVAARIKPYSSNACLNSTFNNITFTVYEKNLLSNVLIYRVNGGSPSNLFPVSFVNKADGKYEITYSFPSSIFTGVNIIEYKVNVTDFSNNVGAYPTDKEWDLLSTGINTFPYTMNFENGSQGWTNQSLTLSAAWDLGAFGSAVNPSQATENGLKCALFSSSTFAAGASARLTSPCFNIAAMGGSARPLLRFRFSQSNNIVGKRDSITVRVIENGFIGPIVKVAIRPNVQSPYADWFTYEVCLTEYRAPGSLYSFQFDAFSTGAGQNIMIDSIQIIDDAQNQIALTPLVSTICNNSQPFTFTIPNTDPRYVYRAYQTDELYTTSLKTLDTANGNKGDLTLTFVNSQIDTLRYVINAINYGSGTYQAPSSVIQPNYCRSNLPGNFTTIINRFSRPLLPIGGYIIPDVSLNAFNGAANDGDIFKPDAVKVGNTLTYEILSPNSGYNTASYGTKWTILNTSISAINTGVPATNVSYTAPTVSKNAKVVFTPTVAEGDTLFVLATTIRFIATSCDTTVYRFIKVASPIAYGFVTGPRTDTACTGTALSFLINAGNKAGVNFVWNFGEGGNPNSFVNPQYIWKNPGTYRVLLTATSSLGISDTVSKLITVLKAPSASYTVSSSAIVCQNDSAVFSIDTTGAGLSYLWTFPGNISRTIPVTNFKFTKADTNYAVTLKVTNSANACYSINNRIFPSYAKPTAKFLVKNHCQGQFMPYTDSSSIANTDRLGYFWSFSTGEQRQSNSFQIKFANSGTIRVSLKLTSAAGCLDTVSHLVTVYETPQPDFLINTSCTNDSTTFANKTIYAAGIQNASYIWDFGDNSATDTVTLDPRHRYLNNNSGDPFIVKLIASNKFYGCKDSITKNVLVKSAPVAVAELGGTTKIGISSDKVCQGNVVTFNSKSYSSSGALLTCAWLFGNGQSSACNSFNTYPDPGTHTWSLTVTADGCQDTKTGTINVVAKPNITFTKQTFAVPPSRFTVNNRKVFTPSDLATDKNSYLWNFGDADSTTTNQRLPDFTYNKKGSYTVRMQVTTVDGCIVTYSDTVKVDVGVSAGEELAAKFNLVAYPNPFANSTVVSLSLTKAENITITITDILGRVISTNTHNNVGSGKHEFELTSNNFTAAGAYIVKVQIGDEMVVKSLVKQ